MAKTHLVTNNIWGAKQNKLFAKFLYQKTLLQTTFFSGSVCGGVTYEKMLVDS